MCWAKINSKHLICEYCNNFIHFKCASFKNHLKQRPELWICSYCPLKELPFSSVSNIDTPDELLTGSMSENNKDTQRDDNYSNKLKDTSKYYSLSHLNTQSMFFFVRWVPSYVERTPNWCHRFIWNMIEKQ